jgi:hypothetical protein
LKGETSTLVEAVWCDGGFERGLLGEGLTVLFRLRVLRTRRS